MADWRKAKCCGTCAFFDIEKVKTAGGAVRKDRGQQCGWRSTEPWPVSVIGGYGNSRPSPTWVRVIDGEGCECHKPRIVHAICR